MREPTCPLTAAATARVGGSQPRRGGIPPLPAGRGSAEEREAADGARPPPPWAGGGEAQVKARWRWGKWDFFLGRRACRRAGVLFWVSPRRRLSRRVEPGGVAIDLYP